MLDQLGRTAYKKKQTKKARSLRKNCLQDEQTKNARLTRRKPRGT